jgi:rare lipoprotein A
METGLFGRQARRLMLVTSAAVVAAACSNDPPARTVAGVSRPVFSEDQFGVSTSPRLASNDVPKGGGMFKLGSPYKVAGRWYVPREDPSYDEYGIASWYGADFHGRRTANGEVFDANALTAAHPTLPLPCYAYVTNVDNGKTVLVRVNDRGPYVNDRLIDMSYAAAKQLGYASQGRARVRVRYAGRAPLNGDDSRERQFLASRQWQPDARPPVALASTGDFSSRSYGNSALPPEASDRWSPIGYRSSLAGKPPPPPPSSLARWRNPDETANLASTDDGRMADSALPAPRPFASGRNYVQVGIFRDRSNAERLRRELGALGPIEVAPLQVNDGGEVYRVRVGPFSPDAASRAQDQIATYGVGDTAIVTD